MKKMCVDGAPCVVQGTERKGILSRHKLVTMVLFVLFACVSVMFAQDSNPDRSLDAFGLAEKMGVIVEFLTSPWVVGVFFVAFCVECLALMTAGRADGQAWKKFIPVLAGTVLFLAGPTVTKKFMGSTAFQKTSSISSLYSGN